MEGCGLDDYVIGDLRGAAAAALDQDAEGIRSGLGWYPAQAHRGLSRRRDYARWQGANNGPDIRGAAALGPDCRRVRRFKRAVGQGWSNDGHAREQVRREHPKR